VITIYLTLEQILVIHEDQIDRYGGSHGIRDLALLESAVFRPQTTFSDQELYPTIYNKAASLVHSLVLNHPFIDENKRTGVVSLIVFLELNGLKLQVSQSELVTKILDIAAKKLNIEQTSNWLKNFSNEI
jgi:death-on-curing protein